MIEARKCVRCGAMYVSDTEVCGQCVKKDGADIYKLKGFFEKELGKPWAEIDITRATGISQKNLQRFLSYDEFKGVEIINDGIIAALNNGNNEENQEEVIV